MAETAYALTYDGGELAPAFRTIAPGVIAGRVGDGDPTGQFDVFRTPLADMRSLDDTVHEHQGETVTLGDVATHVASGREVELAAESGYGYDWFYTRVEDGARVIAGGGRYVVTDDPEHQVSSMLTFDEAVWLGAAALGVEKGDGVQARVEPMTAWGDGGRLAIAGFNLGEAAGESDSLSTPGVMVDHLGGVDYYHGLGAAGTRAALGLGELEA